MTGSTQQPFEINVSRVIPAPPATVFDAWIDPSVFSKWWLTVRHEGPSFCHFDARVGGRYTIKQIGSGSENADKEDNFEWIMTGEYLEVVRPTRLVFTWNVNHPNERTADHRVTVRFEEVADGTRVSIQHTGVMSVVIRDGTDAGWTTLLGLLERLFAGAVQPTIQ